MFWAATNPTKIYRLSVATRDSISPSFRLSASGYKTRKPTVKLQQALVKDLWLRNGKTAGIHGKQLGCTYLICGIQMVSTSGGTAGHYYLPTSYWLVECGVCAGRTCFGDSFVRREKHAWSVVTNFSSHWPALSTRNSQTPVFLSSIRYQKLCIQPQIKEQTFEGYSAKLLQRLNRPDN